MFLGDEVVGGTVEVRFEIGDSFERLVVGEISNRVVAFDCRTGPCRVKQVFGPNRGCEAKAGSYREGEFFHIDFIMQISERRGKDSEACYALQPGTMGRGEAWIDTQMKPKNLFSPIGSQGGAEVFDELISMLGVRLERIFSHGCPTPPDEWYDQGSAEWVVLLRGHAVLEWENGAKDSVSAGDFFVIPPHQRHRVDSVSSDAVWLALHYEDC